MKLYHYTLKDNVPNILREGIREGSYWCSSIDDCIKFIEVYYSIFPNPCEIAFICVDFKEDEIVESDDHNKSMIKCKAYYRSEKVSKDRLPMLFDIPLYEFSR